MGIKYRIVLDHISTSFPNDGSPLNIKGYRALEISNIHNDTGVEIVINTLSVNIGGRLPFVEKARMPIGSNMVGIMFHAVGIQEREKVSFEIKLFA